LYVKDIYGDNSRNGSKNSGGILVEVKGGATETWWNDVLIENCTVRDVARTGIATYSSWRNQGGHTAGLGRWIGWQNIVIRNNMIDTVGGDGIIVRNGIGAVIEHNVAKDCNYDSYTDNVAIWPWGSNDTLVQYNEAYSTHSQRDGQGFDSDYNCNGSIFQYNYSHDNEGGFMLICCGGTQNFNNGTIIRYNISQNDKARVFNFVGPTTNTTIYNNTIYLNAASTTEPVRGGNWDGLPSNVSFYNNIFYYEHSGQYAEMEKISNITFDYNVFYGYHPSNEPVDAHKITEDPLLINPGSGSIGRTTVDGYKLRANSPVINTGKQITDNGGVDYWGNSLYTVTPDRGAFESDVTVINDMPELLTFEAEQLNISDISAGITCNVNYASDASNGTYLILEANSVGNSVSYEVDIEHAGVYKVCPRMKFGPDRGKCILTIAKETSTVYTGSETDTYSSSYNWVNTDMGEAVIMQPGRYIFRFEVSGKNNSSRGYRLFLDNIVLEKTGEVEGVTGTRYEAENLQTEGPATSQSVQGNGYSGGAACHTYTSQKYQYVQYEFDVVPGEYEIVVGLKKGSNMAMVLPSMSVPGTSERTYFSPKVSYDMYDTAESVEAIYVGTYTFTQTTNQLVLGVFDKNSSSSGYNVCCDYIELIPVE
jgi:hypothetical protein